MVLKEEKYVMNLVKKIDSHLDPDPPQDSAILPFTQ
jgi:hypothetical protein